MSSATGSIAVTSRPSSARRQPSVANAFEIAAPIPLAGPVITATRPFSARSMQSSTERGHPARSSRKKHAGGTPALQEAPSKQRLWQFGRRRQERAGEDFLFLRGARQ